MATINITLPPNYSRPFYQYQTVTQSALMCYFF